jgi:hypothetical protein
MLHGYFTKIFNQLGGAIVLPALVFVGGGGATTSSGGSIGEMADDGATTSFSSAAYWTKLSSGSSGIRPSLLFRHSVDPSEMFASAPKKANGNDRQPDR